MKKIISLNVYKMVIASLCLAVGLPLMAADTGQINYQARLLDSYGRRVNDTVDLSFKIYDAVSDGNLLWSETQAGVVVQDGVYSVVLGSQTAIPASVFAQNNIYLELGINGETMTPRQQITASAYSLVTRTIMGSNIFENQTSGYVGVGTTNPAVKLDVSGTVQATGIKIPTGATANYVLASDANGVGTWQPYSVVVTEHDPIYTNWVRLVYAPTTNSIWSAIGAEATTRENTDTALQNNIVASSNALSTAVGLRVLKAGDTMTGPLTNFAGFVGNGAGLTNVPSGGVILTGYVHRIGDTMTGPLVVSNNVTVTLTNQAGYFVATNSISLGGTVITGWYDVAGGAVSSLSNSVSTLTGTVNNADTGVTALNTSTTTLNTAVTKVKADVVVVSQHVDLVQSAQTAISNKVDLHTGQIGAISQHVDLVQSAQTAISNKVDLHTGQIGAISNTANTAKAIADGLNTRSNAWDNGVVTREGTAGDAITYSNLYYYKSDSKWYKAAASTTNTANSLLGLALGNVDASSAITNAGGLLLNGYCTNTSWGFTAGDIIYMSTNTSGMTKARPTGTNHIVRIVGYAISDTKIYFNPDRTYIEIMGQ